MATTLKEGLEQTVDYADKCGTDEAHLIIFDKGSKKPWGKRIYKKEKIFGKIDPKWAIPLTVLFVVLTYSIRRGYFLF